MFTVEGCFEMTLLKHQPNHIFRSLYFRKQIGYECQLLFQNVQNLIKIQKIETKIEKMLLFFQRIAFDIVPEDSTYNKKNTCDRQSMF